jgi:hypothetical protein
MWDCADMPPMFSAKWNIDDSSVLKKKIVNFWYHKYNFTLKKIILTFETNDEHQAKSYQCKCFTM